MLSNVSVKCDFHKGQSCPRVDTMLGFPDSWEISGKSKNQAKAALSHLTRWSQILLSSLATCFTANSEGLGRTSLSNSLYVLNSRHCDRDNWRILVHFYCTPSSTQKLSGNTAGETKLLLLLMLNIRSCMGSFNFKGICFSLQHKIFSNLLHSTLES